MPRTPRDGADVPGSTVRPSRAPDGSTTEAIHTSAPVRYGTYRLVVCEGVNVGASLIIDTSTPSRVLVGSSRACQLEIQDPKLSRRHAAFDVGPRGVTVTDLDSMNGTRVNGVLVREAILEGGELLRVGQTTLRLDVAAPRGDAQTSPSASFGRLVGASVAMRRLFPLCERLAASDIPVVIEGETGTGKELLAEAIHEVGPRRAKGFVVFDCAGASPEAALPVLFGDGMSEGASLFEQAEGGTLLIDEVAELGADAQGRLLRLINHGEVRLEGRRAVTVDVRLLAATRRDLEKEVQAGRFRDDLFYRLAIGRIELPPLRDRGGDVALLANVFWKRNDVANRPFPSDVLSRFEHYRWPGNVRELENVVTRRLTLGPFDVLGHESARGVESEDLIERVLAQNLPLVKARAEVVDQFERRYLSKVLEVYGGSVSRAAAASGIARRYFQILRARHTPK